MQHRFDYRMRPALVELAQGRTTQPVRCLTCKQPVYNLATQCSGPTPHNDTIYPSRNLVDQHAAKRPIAVLTRVDKPAATPVAERSNIHA